MRILITGANGLLGQKLADMLQAYVGGSVLCMSKSSNRNPSLKQANFLSFDLTDFSRFMEGVQAFQPTHIIHTAAITSVEACEQEPEQCERINVLLSEQIAQYCKENNIHLTFLSTDFVFDGTAGPYAEGDATNPCNRYGKSKLDAERRILQTGCRTAILRTILVYGVIADRKRSNIVLWVKNALTKGENISVVSDQWRMPTWVDDLARACILASEREAEGIFHISGNELFSILEIAQQVASFWKLDTSLISPVTARDIGQEFNRPKKTGFSIKKAQDLLGYRPTPFLDSLKEIEQQLATIKYHE